MCSCLCTVLAVSVLYFKKKHWNRLRENSKIRHFVISSHLFYWHANHIRNNMPFFGLIRRIFLLMVICRISIWNLSAAGKIAVALENNFWQIQKKIAFYYWNPFSYLHPSLILLTYVYLLEGWKLWGWSPDRDIFLAHFFLLVDFLHVLDLSDNVLDFSPLNLFLSIRNGWKNGW